MGHIAQEKSGNVICMEEQGVVNSIISKLETVEAEVDVDNVPDTRAWMICCDDLSQTSPGYKAIFCALFLSS